MNQGARTARVARLDDELDRLVHADEVKVAGLEDVVEFVVFETNGVRLHAAVAGPEDGPLVVLLHGFPEFWYSWHAQIRPLAKAGYRVVAPDQRGYNLSDKPKGVRNYTRDVLCDDVMGIIEACGREKIHLVGHDWGGGVAWWFAERHPDRLLSLTILNCPHHAAFTSVLMGNGAQILKSWYMFLFQVPKLAEWALERNDFALGERAFGTSVRDNAFTDKEIALYKRTWSQPGAPTAMVNWYRAAARSMFKRASKEPICTPTLVIWGVQDMALDISLPQPSIEHCTDARLELLEHASHWVMQDAPEKVTAFMLDFLASR